MAEQDHAEMAAGVYDPGQPKVLLWFDVCEPVIKPYHQRSQQLQTSSYS